MKNLKIEVSSIANVVTNGNFELWENNVPYGWVGYRSGYANTLWGLGVQLVVAEGYVAPFVTQIIPSSNFTTGNSYTIGIWSKHDVKIYVHGTGGMVLEEHNDAEWTFHEHTFQADGGDITIQLSKINAYDEDGINVCFIDNCFVYSNDWYPERKELKMTAIKNFENFTREVEDDLFTFKSDALSFTIKNYGSDGSYFNTNDFETYSDRIFRFDILATYDGANGSDIVKKMVLFSNNDTIHKTRQPKSNDLEIQLYELSTLFKDNGWFLGKVVTDEEAEETYFRYNTYNGTDPSIMASGVSIDDVLTNIQSDIRDLIRRHFIPVPLNDFVVNNEIVTGKDTIDINYDWLIDNQSNRYIVLDVYATPISLGRMFFMLLPYELRDGFVGSNDISIWEMQNGSTLKKLVTPTITWSPLSANGGLIGERISIGFIHDIETTTYPNSSDIMFGIIQNIRVDSTYGRKGRRKLYTNNAGISIMGSESYNESNEDDIKLYYKSDWVTTNEAGLELRKCMYIASDGHTTFPETYDPNKDNMIWFDEVTTEFEGTDGDYAVSNLVQEGNMTSMKLVYANNLNASIYKFPHYYTFLFKDAFPSDVLKDLCVSQDALWYLDYSQTNDHITLTIKNRTAGTSSETINDNVALREDSFVRRIKFKDLDGTIFRDDATRLNYYLAFYNSTYGGGKFEKEFEMKGYRDYSLGDTTYYVADLPVATGDYFIKRFEYYTNSRRTLVTIFKKGN